MTTLHLLATSAALSALTSLAPAVAEAQQRSPAFGPRITLPSHSSYFGGHFGSRHHHGGKFDGGHHGGEFHGGHHGGKFHGSKFHGGKFYGDYFNDYYFVEREVVQVVEVEVQRDPPPTAPPPAPPPSPRKPYVIGSTYASLPGGCMKIIEGGASFYYCGGGEWYRLVGKQYRSVAKP